MSIENIEGFDRFTRSHRDYGVVVGHDGGVKCQEWIPNARAVFLKGQFSKYKFGKIQSNKGVTRQQICKQIFRIFRCHSQSHFSTFLILGNWRKIPYNSVGHGKWELFLPPRQDGNCPLPHLTELKVGGFSQDNCIHFPYVVSNLTETEKASSINTYCAYFESQQQTNKMLIRKLWSLLYLQHGG